MSFDVNEIYATDSDVDIYDLFSMADITEIETEVINEETGEPEISIDTITVLEHWEWQDVPIEPVPTQPTNAELAQLVSDLQADLLIAGVI